MKGYLKAVYDVEAKRVHTVNYEGKKKRSSNGKNNYFYRRADYKKVYVQLHEKWYPPDGVRVVPRGRRRRRGEAPRAAREKRGEGRGETVLAGEQDRAGRDWGGGDGLEGAGAGEEEVTTGERVARSVSVGCDEHRSSRVCASVLPVPLSRESSNFLFR